MAADVVALPVAEPTLAHYDVKLFNKRSFDDVQEACGGLPVAEGAGLPVAGLTAHQCLTESAGIKLDGSSQQKNILITAASRGVGQYAVLLQLEYTDIYNQQAEKQKTKRRKQKDKACEIIF
ncbi:hypothetical protein FF2_013537 [Malus domestica]